METGRAAVARLSTFPIAKMLKEDGLSPSLGDGKKWLDAFSDPLAQLYAFSSSITLSDLNGDGDHKLVVADLGTGKFNMTLKVYKGVTLFKENALVDLPTAVLTFFMDQEEPRVPVIGVASGPSVFIYKNLKPYYKFNVPGMPISEAEKEIWNQVRGEQLDLTSLTEFLESLKTQVTLQAMTPRSQKFLSLHSLDEKKTFIKNYTREELKKPTTITCMGTLKKSSIDRDAIDCLVVGCENGSVYFVDGEALTVMRSLACPSAPVFLHTSGLYDVEYRLLVACRNGAVYTVKRDTQVVKDATIELNSHAVGMIKIGKNIVLGCMDRTLRAYSLKGRKQWSLTMPAQITAIANMDYTPKNYAACLVALENGEMHIYQDVFLVDLLRFGDVVTGMRFGQFGREEGALVSVLKGGGLSVKVFKRTARLEEKAAAPGPPMAQSQKLNIPKKTKIFVDQTIREREEAQKMHTIFQREQFLLRLTVARDYCKMLDAKLNPLTLATVAANKTGASGSGAASLDQIKLSAAVQGFGPVFRLKVTLDATGSEPVIDLCLSFFFNTRLYSVGEPILPVGMLIPGLSTTLSTSLKCMMPEKGLSDDIKVFVIKEGHSEPLITAVITMPVSEISMLD